MHSSLERRVKAVTYSFQRNSFQHSNLTDYFKLDQQRVLKKVEQNSCTCEEHFFKAVKNSNKLIPAYSKIKTSYKEEECLSETIYHEHRSAITKFRIPAHCFPIK